MPVVNTMLELRHNNIKAHCLWDHYVRDQCNTLIKSHQNERDPEVVHVWDYTAEDVLKELIGIIYTNKMHQLFGSPSHKNSIVKCVWLKVVMRWDFFWEVSQKTCE